MFVFYQPVEQFVFRELTIIYEIAYLAVLAGEFDLSSDPWILNRDQIIEQIIDFCKKL